MDEFSWRWDQTETILKTQVSGLWAKMKIYCSELKPGRIVLHPPLPFKNWRKQAKATPVSGWRALLAALKSHLAIYLGDIPLTANQSTWCLYQVGGVCLISPTPRINCFISFSALSAYRVRSCQCGLSPGCSALIPCLFSFPRKPSHGCRAAPKGRLEAKPTSSPLPSHPGLAQITQFRMMVPLGHFAKGASLDDLIDSCVQSFGELANCPHA